MANHVVSDEHLGLLFRRLMDLSHRVREGILPMAPVLDGVQYLKEGNFSAMPIGLRLLIDCDTMPYVPVRWKGVRRHTKGGEITFDPVKVRFYQSERQRSDGLIPIKDLIAETDGKRRGNACILDHLLANTNLIPDSWKFNGDGSTRYILFLDTEFLDGNGNVCVRYLCWSSGQWNGVFHSIGDGVGAQGVVFLLSE